MLRKNEVGNQLEPSSFPISKSKKFWGGFLLLLTALTGWILVSVPLVALADRSYGTVGRFLGLLGMIVGIAAILKLFQSETELETEPELEPDLEPEPELEAKPEQEPELGLEPGNNGLSLREHDKSYAKRIDEILQQEDIPEDKGFCIPIPYGGMGYTTKRILRFSREFERYEALDPKDQQAQAELTKEALDAVLTEKNPTEDKTEDETDET